MGGSDRRPALDSRGGRLGTVAAALSVLLVALMGAGTAPELTRIADGEVTPIHTPPPPPTNTPPPTPEPEETASVGAEVAESAPAPEPASTPEATPLPEDAIVVAVDGTPSGSGSLGNPLDLATALGPHSPVQPGGAVFLRGGTYHGTFTSELQGTPSQPITIRSFPGEWAVLDGGSESATVLTIQGDDTHVASLQMARSDPERRTNTSVERPPNFTRAYGNGVDVYGARAKLFDLVVHDHRHGIGLWRSAIDAEVSGAVIFHNGYISPERGRGHGIYVQNLDGTKRISNSVIFRNFGLGISGFGVNNFANGITIEGVTSFDNGAPAGRGTPNIAVGTFKQPVERATIQGNFLYHRPSGSDRNLQVGYPQTTNFSAAIRDNIVVGAERSFRAINFRQLEVRGNLFHSNRVDTEPILLAQVLGAPFGSFRSSPGYTWDGNIYIDESRTDPTRSLKSFGVGDKRLTFEDWKQALGADLRSSYITYEPGSTDVFIRTSGGGHATITVFNWAERRSVEIDPAEAGLQPGTAFEIKDAQDFLGPPVFSGTWNGGTIEIPLDSSSVSQPYGTGFHPVERTPLEFGAFVLQPK